jgi:subtilase family serine protease
VSGVPAYQTLKLALRNENLDKFQNTFDSITDPRSHEFGRWLTHEQLTEMLAPSHDSQRRVEEWLDRVGAVNVQMSRSLDWVVADLPVRAVEQEFETVINAFHVRAGPAQKVTKNDSNCFIIAELCLNLILLMKIIGARYWACILGFKKLRYLNN